jgi:hypothetical protein
MEAYLIFALAAFVFCLAALLFHFIRLIALGKPRDLSQPTGNARMAMPYAFVGAMSPTRKESAFLYLPTYLAGIVYHLGTFAALLFFGLIVANVQPGVIIAWGLAGFFAISGLCGFGILIKRMVKPQMRALSNPDDYIANLLVSIFQWATAAVLLSSALLPAYLIIAGLLFLYIPAGKLKHTVYFFAARYQLGSFFGHRGVWPPK